jgi:hypothetical protein
MATDVLEVGAVINLAQILPGLDTLAAKTEGTCAQMTMSFAGPAQASLAFGRGFALSVPEIVKIPPAVDTIPPAMARAGSSAMQARMAMMGMGQEMGVALPRFVRSFLTSVGPVAGIMAAAFLPVAIIGVVEWLAKIPAAIGKASDAIMGFGKAQKEAFAEAVKGSAEAFEHAKTLEQATFALAQSVATLGILARQTFSERLVQGFKDSAEATSDWWGPLKGVLETVSALRAAFGLSSDAATKASTAQIAQLTTQAELQRKAHEGAYKQQEAEIQLQMIGAKGAELTRLQTQLLRIKQNADEYALSSEGKLTERQIALLNEKYRVEREGVGKKAELKGEGEAGALAKAEVDAHKSVADAIIAQQLALAREAVEIDKGKWPQMIAAERAAEDEMYVVAVNALNRKKEIAAQEAALHGKSGAAEAATINGEIEALAIKHQTKLDSISAEGTKHLIADGNAVEAAFRAQFEAQGKAREMAAADAKRGDEESMRADEERVSFAEMIASRTLRVEEGANSERLRAHQENLKTWAADETASINKWYAEQHRLLELELADAERIYGVGTTDYMRVVARMEALDQDRAAKSQKVNAQVEQNFVKTYSMITGIVNHNIASWITGHETFGRMVISIADEMATALINYFLKEAEQYLLGFITKKFFAEANVSIDAGRAGAGAFASVMESVPFPLNMALAPAMATVAMTQTMAYGSFDTGGLAQKTGLAMIHQGEIAMPAEVSSAFRSMAAGGPVGGGRTVHHHTTFNLHHNGPDAKEVLETQLVPMIRQAQRRGELGA